MYRGEKILAVIPARGGSKGILKKNIIDIKGFPMISYTIYEAKSSKYLDRVIISTEDRLIKKISEEHGGDVPFLRPQELAQDNSKTIDCIVHALEELKSMGEYYDYVVILQCTSPLRKSWHVDEAIEKLINSHKDSLVSISEVEDHPILMRTLNEDGSIKKFLNVESTVRRQDFQKIYKVDGAIYIQKLNSKFNNKTSLNDGELPYIMEKKYTVDVNEYLNIREVEYYLEELGKD